MKILITGGAGFIGSHLADSLLEKKHQIYSIDDLSTGSMDNISHLNSNDNYNFIYGDIRNELIMDRLVSKCDAVYHLAAAVGVNLIINDPIRVMDTNIKGTEMLLKICNRYKKRIVVASTSEIYGKSDKIPFSESDDRILGSTEKSRWSYSSSKAIDEYYSLAYNKQYGLETIIVRLFNTVGPRQTGQYGMVMPRFVKNAINNKQLDVFGDGTQIRTFGYVKDVVRGLELLMDNDNSVGEIFNIGGDEQISILNLAEKIIDMTSSKSKIKFIPYKEAYADGFEDMKIRKPDISKINSFTGYKPLMNLDGIIKSIIDYYKY